MPVYQYGALNLTALIVPDLYVIIVPPQQLALNGVPSDIVGLVGTAQWGPVNQPVIIGTPAAYAAAFGALQNRTYDMGTYLAIAVQQGAQNFRCVRVTDGTDEAASAEFLTGITLTAKYTGSLGNQLSVTFGPGSKASTGRMVVSLPGGTPEVYDNIPGTGAAFWTNLASAITNGNGSLRGPSQLVTAVSAGGTTAYPATNTTYGFVAGTGVTNVTAGTDGATTITDATLLGQNTGIRTGMYVLTGQGCEIMALCDLGTYADFVTFASFAQYEEAYAIVADPAGSVLSATGITTAITNKATAGLDTYSAKIMFGDWIYWADPVNLVTRLVSPVPFVAGRLANLSPEQSSLNKPIYGIQGTQKSGLLASGTVNTYALSDLTSLAQAGFDVISNPQPGGAFWGCRIGHNSSSNAAINGDNYTRLTNYISSTLAAGMGGYVGDVVNVDLFQSVEGTLTAFLANLLNQGLLGTTNPAQVPFEVQCDLNNNPQSLTELGYVTANVNVQYQAINEKFIVNLEGGDTVNVSFGGQGN